MSQSPCTALTGRQIACRLGWARGLSVSSNNSHRLREPKIHCHGGNPNPYIWPTNHKRMRSCLIPQWQSHCYMIRTVYRSIWSWCRNIVEHSISHGIGCSIYEPMSIWKAKLPVPLQHYMMTSWTGNIVRVTGHLCGEFTGHRWIPCTKASDAEL